MSSEIHLKKKWEILMRSDIHLNFKRFSVSVAGYHCLFLFKHRLNSVIQPFYFKSQV